MKGTLAGREEIQERLMFQFVDAAAVQRETEQRLYSGGKLPIEKNEVQLQEENFNLLEHILE